MTTFTLDEARGIYVPPALHGKATPEEIVSVDSPQMGESGVPQPGPIRPEQLLKMYADWVYSCVDRNAQGVARTPLRLYFARQSRSERTFYRTKAVPDARTHEMATRNHLAGHIRKAMQIEEVVDEHPFYSLWDRGNPYLTGSQLKRVLVMHLDLVGDFFAYIKEGDYGPEYVLVMQPDKMRIVTADNLVGLIKAYLYKDGATDVPIPPEQVMHCKHPDPSNPLYGLSPLEAVALPAVVYRKMYEFDSAILDNGAIPAMVGVAKDGISTPERKRAEALWNQRFGGVRRAGKFGIIAGDLDLKQFGLSPRDMQSRDARQLLREEIASAFGVPMQIMQTHDVNRANAREGEHSHAAHGIRPRCHLIEDQINRDIIPKYDDRLFVAFDSPIPKDEEFELKREEMYLKTYVYPANRVLEAHNEEPVPWGDKPVVPIGMGPMGEILPMQNQPAPQEPTRAAKAMDADRTLAALIRAWSGQVEAEVLPRIRGYAGRETKREDKPPRDERDEAFDITTWSSVLALSASYVLSYQFENAVSGALDTLRRHAGERIIAETDLRGLAAEYAASEPKRFALSVSRTLNDALGRRLADGIAAHDTAAELADRVSGLFADWRGYKAEQIAITEEVRATRRAELETWKRSKIVSGVRWKTMPGACEFCIEIENTVMAIGEAFVSEGDELSLDDGRSMVADYGDVLHPPLHANCRCELEPVFEEYGA